MNLNAKISIGIRRFFKKYGKLIAVILVFWLIIIVINQFLKNRPKEIVLKNTYTPDKAVIDKGGDVPTRQRNDIKEVIDNYIKYCNYKEYEKAYSLLTTSCREYLYDNDIEVFKDYVDDIFKTKKIYNIQNYSNVDGTYIYSLTILDDIEATGTTGGYEEYVEKIAVRMVADEYLISNQGYIDNKKYNIISEDDNLRVEVKSKDMSYEKEGYNVTLTNKTDKYIVILDNTLKDEITLNLTDQKRTVSNFSNGSLILSPGQTANTTLIFTKFYDDRKDPTEISFENVRVLDRYDANMENTENLAERMYSFNISLKK